MRPAIFTELSPIIIVWTISISRRKRESLDKDDTNNSQKHFPQIRVRLSTVTITVTLSSMHCRSGTRLPRLRAVSNHHANAC